MMPYTDTEKLEAIRREIKWRKRVYPNRVETGRMPPAEAAFQISIMEAIAVDYERLAAKERLF
jgi:hypothetical protein